MLPFPKNKQINTRAQLRNYNNATGQVSEVDGDEDVEEEVAEIGFCSGFAWLFAVTAITALLSEYVVGTIEVISTLCS